MINKKLNKKNKKALKVYGFIGKILCACAGAIVGFTLGGLMVATLCTFVGIGCGHLLEKWVVNTSFSETS